MLSRLTDLTYIVVAAVQLVVIVLVLIGPARKFLVLLIYVVAELVSTSALTLADMLYGGSLQVSAAHASAGQKLYTHLYWTDDVVLDLLLFLTVIVLTYQATEGTPLRAAAGKLLGGVALAAVILPFALFHPTFTPWPKGSWFNSADQLLNFGGAIMNLALWTALIGSRRRDPQLLTVSAGLGILVTGAAISLGLVHFIPPGGLRWLPTTFLLLTHLTGLLIWCWAFRPATRPHRQSTEAASLT